MNRPFYIVPVTKSFYDIKTAETPEDALVTFAEEMDMDMSAYFRAVDKEPAIYPHGYRYPEGSFECAMSIIVASMDGNTKASYYVKDALEGVDISKMGVIAKLQESYDMLKGLDVMKSLKVRKHYYQVLKKLTGFSFDKKGKPDPTEKVDILFHGDLQDIESLLDEHNIPYDANGSAGRYFIERQYLDEVMILIEEIGFDAEVI